MAGGGGSGKFGAGRGERPAMDGEEGGFGAGRDQGERVVGGAGGLAGFRPADDDVGADGCEMPGIGDEEGGPAGGEEDVLDHVAGERGERIVGVGLAEDDEIGGVGVADDGGGGRADFGLEGAAEVVCREGFAEGRADPLGLLGGAAGLRFGDGLGDGGGGGDVREPLEAERRGIDVGPLGGGFAGAEEAMGTEADQAGAVARGER